MTASKKLKSGFTLVELIIVMALMSILMGAILSFVNPVSNLFRKTAEYTNQRAAAKISMDYIFGNLRYSTDMLVIENFEGVPIITSTNGLDKYDNCLILEYYPATDIDAEGNTVMFNVPAQVDFKGRMWALKFDPNDIQIKGAIVPLGEGLFDKDLFYFSPNFGTGPVINSDISFRIRLFNNKGRPSYQTVNTITLMNHNVLDFVIKPNTDFIANPTADSSVTGLPDDANKAFTYIFYNNPAMLN